MVRIGGDRRSDGSETVVAVVRIAGVETNESRGEWTTRNEGGLDSVADIAGYLADERSQITCWGGSAAG